MGGGGNQVIFIGLGVPRNIDLMSCKGQGQSSSIGHYAKTYRVMCGVYNTSTPKVDAKIFSTEIHLYAGLI